MAGSIDALEVTEIEYLNGVDRCEQCIERPRTVVHVPDGDSTGGGHDE
jgi:hypothetical protein